MNLEKTTKQDLMSVAFDMKAQGYGYEAIADYLDTSVHFAKRLVTDAITKEKLGGKNVKK